MKRGSSKFNVQGLRLFETCNNLCAFVPLSLCTFLLLSAIVTGCKRSGIEEYNHLKSKELSSGKRVDSLFFGIYFGMTSKQFFSHCWEMNKKGIFTDGLNNTAVLYKLNNGELKHSASMNFYPVFKDNRITEMKANFQYDGWAPWNKQMFSDSLINDVLSLFNKWYAEGNKFIRIDDEKKGTIYVKVDGNRRITIGRYDDMQVKVNYTDLLEEQKIKAQ